MQHKLFTRLAFRRVHVSTRRGKRCNRGGTEQSRRKHIIRNVVSVPDMRKGTHLGRSLEIGVQQRIQRSSLEEAARNGQNRNSTAQSHVLRIKHNQIVSFLLT